MLSKNFKAAIKEFIVNGKAHGFMRLIKGTPALGKNQIFFNWWKNIKYIVIPKYVENIQIRRVGLILEVFTKETIIVERLQSNISTESRNVLLKNRNNILWKVKEYINRNLNPSARKFTDSSKNDSEDRQSVEAVLEELGISKTIYLRAWSISDKDDFQIYLKKSTNSCFVNYYFYEGLMTWEAYIDIKPVFYQYKAMTYMFVYLSKLEDECSQAIKQGWWSFWV